MTTAQPSESAPAPAPTASPAAATIRPEPQAVTLQVTDLPPGYHVLKTGPALFSPNAGQATPASWDVVFAPDTSLQPGYLLVESAVAVYADTEAAVAAVKTEDEAEESVHGRCRFLGSETSRRSGSSRRQTAPDTASSGSPGSH